MELKGKKVVKPTWKICFIIWWSFFWRSLLWGGIVGFIIALIIALPARLFGLRDIVLGMVALLVWGIVYTAMGIVVFKRILINKYRTFEILLIKEDEMAFWKI